MVQTCRRQKEPRGEGKQPAVIFELTHQELIGCSLAWGQAREWADGERVGKYLRARGRCQGRLVKKAGHHRGAQSGKAAQDRLLIITGECTIVRTKDVGIGQKRDSILRVR